MKHNYLKSLFLMLMMCVGMSAWATIETGTYTLCTSTSDLEAGAHYIIASGTSGTVKCISNVENANNRKIVDATVADNKITVGSNSTIMTLTLGGSTGSWTFQTDNYAGTNGYFASAASGNNNYCRVISDETKASITFDDNAAIITLQPHTSRNILRYNSSSSLFACYSSGQDAVYLYKKTGDIVSNTFTVTVVGNISNGTVTANPTSATEGTEITLEATPADGYKFGSWNVTNASTSEAITVTDNKFTMPAANVNVNATFEKTQENENEPSYNFADMTNFSSWGSSYEKKTTTFSDGAYVELASANRSTSTVTDCPVTKGGDVIFKAPAGKTITSLTFTCTQWSAKAQTITLNTSSDGTNYTATSTTSSNFVLSASDLNNVTAVKFTFSSTSNQVGIKSLKVIYANGTDTPDPETPGTDPDEKTYTISVKEDIFNGSVTVSTIEAKAGETVTITATPDEGYEVEEYIAYSTENSATDVTVTDGTFTMPAYNVTVNVLFKKKQGGETPDTPDTPVVGDGVTYNFGSFTQANDVTLEANGFTVTLHKNTGSTVPQWNGSSSEARVYAKGSVEVTSTKNIVKIVYDYNVNANKNNVAPTIDGVTGSTTDGTWDATIKTWTGNDKSVTLTTSGTAGNLGFKSITVYFEEEAVPDNGTINFVAHNNDGYWATFSCDKDVIFDANDVEVYTVAVDDNSLVMIDAYNNSNSCVTDETKDEGWVAGYYVQAGAAVLINSLDESVNYYFIDNDPYTANQLTEVETDPEYNMLRPASETMTGKYTFMKLAYKDFDKKTGLGFYCGKEGGAPFNCKAGTAYLAVPSNVTNAVKGFSFEDIADAIKNVEEKTFDTVIYDMQGRKVSKAQKGIYIINGRKMVK